MRTKQFILAVGLLFVPLLSMADNVIKLIGTNGETLVKYDASTVDSITTYMTMESHGNYAYDFNGYQYSGLVDTYWGNLESFLLINSDGPWVQLNNVDPYFASYGYTYDNGAYNIVLCDRSEWVSDTLYLYARAGQLMQYYEACFCSYTGAFESGDYDEEIVFAITDNGQTFTYVNGLVVAEGDSYYNYIEPGTSIVPEGQTEAPVRRAPKARALPGKKVLPPLQQAEVRANAKAAVSVYQTLNRPSEAADKALSTERTAPKPQTPSKEATRRLFKVGTSETKAQAAPAERARAIQSAVTTDDNATAGGSSKAPTTLRQTPGHSMPNRRAMTADDVTVTKKNDKK